MTRRMRFADDALPAFLLGEFGRTRDGSPMPNVGVRGSYESTQFRIWCTGVLCERFTKDEVACGGEGDSHASMVRQ